MSTTPPDLREPDDVPLVERGRSDEPDEALAARLLGATRTAPHAPANRARVWAAVAQPGRRGGRAWWWQPALVAALLCGFVAVASARWGHALVRRVLGGEERAPVAAPPLKRVAKIDRPGTATATTAAPSPPAAPLAASATASLSERTAPAAAAPLADATSAAAPSPSPRHDEARRARTAGDEPPSTDEVSPETRLLDEGLRARPDPARALGLYLEYLDRYPGGAFVEEVYGRAIEAAARSGDPRQPELAARYLARFPAGRFVTAARRAQQQPLSH